MIKFGYLRIIILTSDFSFQVTELFKQMREQGGLAGHQAAGGYGAIGTTPAVTASPTTPRRRMPPRSQSSAANLTSLCADISPSSSHFFEVLYIGKIKVSHKKVPDSFIDDALLKFQAHEDAKAKEKLEKENNRKNEQYSGDKRRESEVSNFKYLFFGSKPHLEIF